MSSIRGETVALDTNVFIFALRKEPDYPACETLLFDKLAALQVYMSLQIFLELQRNLTASEMRRVARALTMAQAVTWDYVPARMDLIRQWEQRGAKKGDAAIAAHLEGAAIRYLVSENRDFLKELPALPFTVLSSEEAVALRQLYHSLSRRQEAWPSKYDSMTVLLMSSSWAYGVAWLATLFSLGLHLRQGSAGLMSAAATGRSPN